MTNLRHRQGVDLNGADGGDFFTYSMPDGISMVSRDPNKIAAAGQNQFLLGGNNALDVADISSVPGGPDNSFRTAIITLGVEVQTVNRRVDIQDNIAQQVDNARDGESGVSIDEEMASMVQFQHTYAAAARMMTAIDEMLDRLINGTGLVGR
jgi:flagellar hook-associated protein 1